MEKGSSCNVGDRWSDLLPCMDDVNSECIHCISANVISIDTRNQNFPFVIIDEKASNHGESWSLEQTWVK